MNEYLNSLRELGSFKIVFIKYIQIHEILIFSFIVENEIFIYCKMLSFLFLFVLSTDISEESEGLCSIIMCKKICFKAINETEIELISSKKAQKFCVPEIKSNIVIPEYTVINNIYFKIKSISEKAFSQNNLKKILIIARITEIGASAFTDCPELENIDLSRTMISSIPNFCFKNCPSLHSVILPPTVKRISDSSFERTGLKEFAFHEIITSIGESVFANNEKLESVDLSKTKFDFLPKLFFANCTSLRNISFPDSLTRIGEGALMETSIESFSFDKIIEIRKCAFERCINLMKADLSSSTLTILNERVFAGCSSLAKIILPRKLEAIFKEAMMETAVTDFVMPQSLVQIGEAALRDCFDLKTVDLSNTVVCDIPSFFLANCTSLQLVSIPITVMTIGESAFEGSSLKAIDLSSSQLENISFRAFKDCKNLEFCFIPTTLKNIKSEAFMGSLLSFQFDLSQTALTAIEERVFLDSQLTEILLPRYLIEIHSSAFGNTNLSSVTIPMKVGEIGASIFAFCANLSVADFSRASIGYVPVRAFYKCVKLETVLLPNSIHMIDSQAFSFASIERIKLPKKLITINDFAFANCTKLKDFALNETNVTSIGAGSFLNCRSLQHICFPSTLESIGIMAFYNSSLLSTVINKVTVLSAAAFAMCEKLASVDISLSQLQIINESMFSGCSRLRFINFPKNLLVVDKFVFQGTGFTTINLPSTLIAMKSHAFANCNSLITVNLASTKITKISKCSFMNCTKLANVSLPPDLQIINSHAFANTSIANVVFPPKVELLRNSFENCKKLKEIDLSETQVYILESGLFAGCTSLSKIMLPAQLDEIKANVFTETNITEIKIPNDCKLNPNVFADTKIVKVDLSETGFTELPPKVFADALNMREIIYPETLKSISENAFLNTGVVELNIPYISEISTNAFTCPYLKKIDLSSSNVELFPQFLFAKCPELREVIIPPHLVDISSNAFQRTKITKIAFPESTATLEEEAFYNCLLLEEIDLSKTKIVSIEARAFYNCMKLKTILWPKDVQEIGQDTFANSGLDKLILPSSMNKIGESCFSQCIYLTSVDISRSGILELPANVFFNCKQLKNVVFGQFRYTLPKNLFTTTSISKIKLPLIKDNPEKLFEKSRTLEVVDMSKCGITRLGDRFFGDCIKLRVVSLPDVLEYVSTTAFQDCFSLQKVYFYGKTCFDDAQIFNKGVSVYVTADYDSSDAFGVNAIVIDNIVDVLTLDQ